MTFKDGDFLEIEYSAWAAADGRMISTTDEKSAKAAGIYNEKARYGPVLVIIGSNSVIKGLDREIRAMSAGESRKMTFKPEDAFGDRRQDLVRIMPLSEFRKRDMDPYPGMQVDIDNTTATVKSITSGRVTVDMNHPYAGQEITYEVKVIKTLDSGKDRLAALGRTYGVEPTSSETEGDSMSVRYADGVRKNADYFIGKANMIASVFTYFKGIKKVEVTEEYLRPEESSESKKEKDAEEAAEE